jgi:hypothetical protein
MPQSSKPDARKLVRRLRHTASRSDDLPGDASQKKTGWALGSQTTVIIQDLQPRLPTFLRIALLGSPSLPLVNFVLQFTLSRFVRLRCQLPFKLRYSPGCKIWRPDFFGFFQIAS